MNELLKYGLTYNDLSYLNSQYSDDVISVINERKEEIKKLLNYLKEYGIVNIPEVITTDINLLFLNKEEIETIFSKYDKQNIILSFKENPNFFQEL